MSETKKKGISHLVRQIGQDIRVPTDGERSPDQPTRIFSVLDYIEQPWGLNMKLYPAQRFLVKLYYNLELDAKIPDDPNRRIQVTDMFKTKVLYELSEKDYLSFLYNEGRCNIGEQDHDRRELVLPIGRRGGKCNDFDSLVLTDRGVFRMEDLYQGALNSEGFANFEVGVVQESGRRARSSHFYNGGVKDSYKFTTRLGYSLGGTANHRVKVLTEEGKIEWRYHDDIMVGDVIAVNRETDLWAGTYLDLRPFIPEGWEPKSHLLDEGFGLLLGLLTGDGTWSNSSYVEVTGLSDQMAVCEDVFDRTLGRTRIFKNGHTRAFRLRYDVTSTGRPGAGAKARNFLHRLGWTIGTPSDQKRVPWAVLRSPRPVVASFLRGLFETDGGVENLRKVTYCTASKEMAREVQILLLNFGVVSNLKTKHNRKYSKDYYVVSLVGIRSLQVFAKEIGFLTERKQAALSVHIADITANPRNKSDTESIPFQRSWCRRLLESVPKNIGDHARGQALGWRRSLLRLAFGNVLKQSSTEDLTYPRLRRVLDIARQVGAQDSEALQHFEGLLGANYFFDVVVALEKRPCQVYDLTVPDGASFVANGMTNHNTTLSGIFASYEVYRLLNLNNPQAYYGLPNGNRIQIISVATDKEQAGLLFNEVTTHLAKCDYFRPFVANNTLSHVNFRTPYDIEKFGPTARQENGKFVSFNGKATLRVTFKSCIAKGLRGAGNIVIILDEVAHFQDKGNSSAEEIYQAVAPSAAAFSRKDPETGRVALDQKTGKEVDVESRIIMISSPLGKSGLFYEKFDLAMRGGEGADNILAVQAPTWEINPTVPSSYYRQKYHANPTVFMTEHGAQFSDQARGWIERESDLQACISALARPKIMAQPRQPHQMGIDVGLVDDGTAIAITHVDQDKIVLDYHEIWYAGMDWREANPHLEGRYSTNYAKTLSDVERLDFDEIADWIIALTKKFHITAGLFDRWNGIPLEQALFKKGHRQFKSEFFTRDQTSKIYQATKMLMYDEKLVLYDYPIPERAREGNVKHSPLIAELLSLQANHISKNIVLVEAPQKAGAHDDMSDALVRSVWLSSEVMSNQKHTAHGTPYRPTVAAAMTPHRYQMSRARHHGLGDRNLLFRRAR